MLRDYLKLHFIILLWGFTGVLGVLISLPAPSLVFWRTALAAAILGPMLLQGRVPLVPSKTKVAALMGIGVIVALHWLSFFTAIKLSGASVGLVGLSTATLWVALLAPIFSRKKISKLEVVLGILVIVALTLIAQASFERLTGLYFSILAAFLAAIFSYLNNHYTKTTHHNLIAFYEMLGAALFTFFTSSWYSDAPLIWKISFEDFCLVFLLSSACTVYAYSQCIELQRRISVFVTNLSVNLEPVYGIILAALLLHEHKDLHPRFYLGASMLIIAVTAYPIITRLRRNTSRKLLETKA